MLAQLGSGAKILHNTTVTRPHPAHYTFKWSSGALAAGGDRPSSPLRNATVAQAKAACAADDACAGITYEDPGRDPAHPLDKIYLKELLVGNTNPAWSRWTKDGFGNTLYALGMVLPGGAAGGTEDGKADNGKVGGEPSVAAAATAAAAAATRVTLLVSKSLEPIAATVVGAAG